MDHANIFSSLVCVRKAALEAKLDDLVEQLDIAILIAAAAVDDPNQPLQAKRLC